MNIIRDKDTVKNSMEEEYDIPHNLELLNKWTIPKVDYKLVYKLGTFERLGIKQVVKTTEETISLNKEDMVIKLLTNRDLSKYKKQYKFLHIGLVQIAFKPLTLEGLPESFVAALRDARNLDWKQSLIGIVQSSLAHGPVYFNVYPNLQLSLSDVNILDSLTLNIKTHGYNYAPGSEVICVCYRIYYKPLFTLNPQCRIVDKPLNETIVIETNFGKSNITTRRKIKWEEINFPDNWIIEKATHPQAYTNNNPLEIVQTTEGSVKIKFDKNLLDPRPRINMTRARSSHFHISPTEYVVESPSRASTSQIREEFPANRVEELRINTDNIVRGMYRNNEPELTESEMNFSV
jgi:hypothetical protein